MARPRGSRNLNLDEQIESIAQRIKDRLHTLRDEIDQRQDEVDRRSERDAQLTGTRIGGAGRGRPIGSGSVGRNGKRIRRLGVDVEWISGKLEKQPMTLKQLQDVALR